MHENPATDEQKNLAVLADKELLRVLEEGEEVIVSGPEGHDIIKKRPSAAMMKVILTRIEKLGIDAPAREGNAAGNLLDAARSILKYDGKAIPSLDMEEDDAATGT